MLFEAVSELHFLHARKPSVGPCLLGQVGAGADVPVREKGVS